MSIEWKEQRTKKGHVTCHGYLGPICLFYIKGESQLFSYLPGLWDQTAPLGEGSIDDLKALAEQYFSSWLSLTNLFGQTLRWKVIHRHKSPVCYHGYIGPFKVFNINRSEEDTEKYVLFAFDLPGATVDRFEFLGEGTVEEMEALAEEAFSDWITKVNLLSVDEIVPIDALEDFPIDALEDFAFDKTL